MFYSEEPIINKAEIDSIMAIGLLSSEKMGKDSVNLTDTTIQRIFTPKKKKEYNRTPKKRILVDLNNADIEQLKRLKGIGPTYASRIIKFRTLLGGYVRKEQLLEVYGIDSANYRKNLENNVKISISSIQTIDINTDSLKVLAKHPYISWDLAKKILNYRRLNGDFLMKEELRLDLLNEDIYTKIAPYLKVDVDK